MSGRCPKFSEVVRRSNDPLTKVMLPDPIDHDTCSQRIIRTRRPLRQREPSTAPVGERRLNVTGEENRKGAGLEFTEAIVSTANVNPRIMKTFVGRPGDAALLQPVGKFRRRQQ